jgi:spermidine synthase
VLVLTRKSSPATRAEAKGRTGEDRVPGTDSRSGRVRAQRSAKGSEAPAVSEKSWLAGIVLGLSGFAALMYEIAWIRVFSLIVGPTTYATAATLVALIGGMALGSIAGTRTAGQARRPVLWLVLALAGAALAVSVGTSLAGTYLPAFVAQEIARSPEASGRLLVLQVTLAAALVVPAAACLGLAFPLSLDLIRHDERVARRVGVVYAVNTLAAVAGSLVAAFVAIPLYGLQPTLAAVSVLLIVAALVVVSGGQLPAQAGIVGLVPVAAAAGLLLLVPPWDRDLLASGAYKYTANLANEPER